MSDNKYTAKEREFIRLHELQHDFVRLEGAVTAWAGERCPDYEATCVVCKTWKAFDVLKESVLFQQLGWNQEEVNEAKDFMITPKLAAALDDIKKETDKAYANMTTREIFQDLEGGITRPIAERGKPMPDQSHLYIDCTTTEDNDDE